MRNSRAIAALLTSLSVLFLACSHHSSERANKEVEAAEAADKEAEQVQAVAASQVSQPASPAPTAAGALATPAPTASAAGGTPIPKPTLPPGTCLGGKKMLLLSGPCPGAWRLNLDSAGKPKSCEYAWGPAIVCPAGTKAMGSTAACFGTMAQDLGPRDTAVKTAENCIAKFGKAPKYFNYDMQCCPE